jgi:hydrogenase maturation protein HypF
MAERAQIKITGIVQGVGFRPYVHSLAARLGLHGFVSNTASGVLIEAEGEQLSEFIDRLPREAPPLARIAGLSVTKLPAKGFSSFIIGASEDLPGAFTLVSPDVSVCEDCLRELQDPNDRRYLYPFTNCTNCGPRYSITRSVPYDRPNTTMASFVMCPDCDREYHDPENRRFHAQPNACPKCGPRVTFKNQGSKFKVQDSDPVRAAIAVLRQGGIVAIKGLGGFHIACDAMNEGAVRTLRKRKRKSNKPFAIMAPSISAISRFCDVKAHERRMLESPRRPIVLLRKLSDSGVAEAVSPNNRYIGVMLPYTPLHMLLFLIQPEADNGPGLPFTALVMTSGNLSEEPIVRDNDEAADRLSALADAFLFHDRDIFTRVDDSVIRMRSSAPDREKADGMMFIRRSRGYAPEPIALHTDGPEVLGCGADLKNTFTLTKGSFAIPSQHIGDMENYETLRFFEETLANLKQVYRAEPVAIVHDLHPGYLSTRWAKEQASWIRSQKPGEAARNEPSIHGIQHHFAHIGSVMAEKGITGKVIGIAFDGTGYGTDGNLWGGEFLIAGVDGFERVAQLKYIPLPGGEAAIREPWRTAVSLVGEATGDVAFRHLDRLGLVARHGEQSVRQVLQVSRISEFSPLASGAGRYFDALAALIGISDRNSYEGEAAMALESLVKDGIEDDYPVDYIEQSGYTTIDLAPLVRSVLDDLSAGKAREHIAARFHNSFASIIVYVAAGLSERTGIRDVALSGGTFQNSYLLERSSRLLRNANLNVHVNSQMPSNDACISLGQAYLVRERLKKQ